MRLIQPDDIARHARERFRSEYHYAVFEYYRSAKVIAFLEQHGVALGGRILDAGCGGGGMPVSLAEEHASVVAIDLKDRFAGAGERLRDELGLQQLHFAQADGTSLPFAAGAFDGVLSHAVIEHVADADRYLAECSRVLKPGGWMYLSTSPYLSFAGAHLPRLVVPVPLHLLLGRRVSFAVYVWLARHASWALRERENENTFIKDALSGRRKRDDLLELVRVRRLRGQIARAGLQVVHEELTLTATFQRLPGRLPDWIRGSALTQDIAISVMQYVLVRARDGVLPGLAAAPGPRGVSAGIEGIIWSWTSALRARAIRTGSRPIGRSGSCSPRSLRSSRSCGCGVGERSVSGRSPWRPCFSPRPSRGLASSPR